ncbi:two-component system LytT family sensor kinase [Glycomyces algeriensis]|uniref:Histidine kinase n=1 Tax=Glycomyces algeriensis TaxID=256037 RepID=A0A9W6GD12_9ACTN|nr:histidine kinase [Glycomyces algeriensis]MDA1366812.1 histidine kinase [Glycomyces algeriensis]MDA1368663.1 histidine kinase [Glycomyces algeriensis]MDR7351700.1 two-component system LytT family sensor kinase [Glycomyces algeriensis]GLI44423.1 histidine kinase [Glycomyces algeriensis]
MIPGRLSASLRASRLASTRRRALGSGALAALRLSRQVGESLADGLNGKGAPLAARRLAKLLAADAVALADCERVIAVAGSLDPAAAQGLLVETLDVLEPVTAPPLRSSPLIVSGDLAGCLLVAGDVSDAEVAEAAHLVATALDHADLDRARERIAAADLRTLRAQISPHFMHNALAAISAHTRTDPERARELLTDFSDYLRYSFANTGDYATVADELQAVQTYLELQRARFDDRLDITVRIAPEVLPVPIPFLVVQPIVENAVRHGFESKPGTGHIAVRGFSEGALCVIEVEDDGAGMEPETAKAILTGSRQGAGRIGLANVDRRLRAVYGPEYGLWLDTAPGEGTKATVRIPRYARGVHV